MAKPLTVKFIEAIKTPATRIEIPDGGCTGLYLVVQPTGKMSWALRYRSGGKPRKMTISPLTTEFGLAVARDAAAKALRTVAEGRDPADERKAVKLATKDEERRVEAVLDEFLRRHVEVKNRASSAAENRRLIENEIRPRWKGRQIETITRRDVVTLLDALVDRGAPVTANRVHALVRKLFNWAMERGLVHASPMTNLKAPTAEVSRDRVLSDDEIRLAWLASEAIGWPFGPFVQLLLLTGQRRDEVASASWDEFSLDASSPSWTIPRERAKNDKGHHVPLSARALEILKALPRVVGKGNFILSTTGETPISGFSRAKAALDAAMLDIARKEAEDRGETPDEVSLAPWRLHDLRRTAASGMAALGQPVHVVEAVLNHKSGSISGIAAVYNRHAYAEEKARALAAWASRVEEIVGLSAPAANVTPIRAKRK